MFLDDFLDVFEVHIVVPDLFGVDDDDGPFVSTIHAACPVDPDLAFALEFQLSDAILGIGLCRGGAQIITTSLTFAALIAA